MTRTRARVLSITLCLAALASNASDAPFSPTGTSIGAVQFDAVIQLDAPWAAARTTLFARYWVSPEYYQVAVVWAEPHARGLIFGVYPPTLSIGSDAKAFRIASDVLPENNEVFSKPLGGRGAFTSKYGDYAIRNVRFAEQEALASRINTSEMTKWAGSQPRGDQTFQLFRTNRSEWDAARIRVETKRNRVDSLHLYDDQQKLIKSLNYEYDGDGTTAPLLRQTARLLERQISAGFLGEGLKITVGGITNRIKEFPTTHHKGGRTSTVEYQTVRLGGKKVSLPKRIEVRGPDSRILRSTQITNVLKTGLTREEAERAAAEFGGFSQMHRDYRAFLLKYWQKGPSDVSPQDAELIRNLLHHFENASAGGNTLGEHLRRLNILMELNRVLGDSKELERHYRDYLTSLGTNGLSEMLLVGGYSGIDTLVIWGRTNQADILLNQWLNAAGKFNDAESVAYFAERELAKGNFWAIAKLLEKFSDPVRTSAAHFEIIALKCVALHELDGLLRKPTGNKDNIAKAQTSWAAGSIDPTELQKLLQEAVVEAHRTWNVIKEPDQKERTLHKRLIGIADTLPRNEVKN